MGCGDIGPPPCNPRLGMDGQVDGWMGGWVSPRNRLRKGIILSSAAALSRGLTQGPGDGALGTPHLGPP